MIDKVMIWKTCRVLANESRLRILKRLMRGAEMCVTDIAEVEGISLVTASQHLRYLHECGFLKQERKSKWIFYSAEFVSGFTVAEKIAFSLKKMLVSTKDRVPDLLRLMTAFTHPRRIDIVKTIAEGTVRFDELTVRCHISSEALQRHLKKLIAREIIEQDSDLYRLVSGGGTLKNILVGICLETS